ncbi:hypothetical protein QJS66_15155 [Kocuria rhizophila]|nr:hypothetical protein QJS66_15155 [Kocuria rhizophila]
MTPSARQLRAAGASPSAVEARGAGLPWRPSPATPASPSTSVQSEEVGGGRGPDPVSSRERRGSWRAGQRRVRGGLNSVIRREPIGVVGQVTRGTTADDRTIWKVGPALAAGSAIMLRRDTTGVPLCCRDRLEFLPGGHLQRGAGQREDRRRSSCPTPRRASSSIARVRACRTGGGHGGGRAPARPPSEGLGGKACVGLRGRGSRRRREHPRRGRPSTPARTAPPPLASWWRSPSRRSSSPSSPRPRRPPRWHTGEGGAYLYGPLNNSRQLGAGQRFHRAPPRARPGDHRRQAPPRATLVFEPTVIADLRQERQQCGRSSARCSPCRASRTKGRPWRWPTAWSAGWRSSVWTKDHGRALRCPGPGLRLRVDDAHIPLVAEGCPRRVRRSGYGKDLFQVRRGGVRPRRRRWSGWLD